MIIRQMPPATGSFQKNNVHDDNGDDNGEDSNDDSGDCGGDYGDNDDGSSDDVDCGDGE